MALLRGLLQRAPSPSTEHEHEQALKAKHGAEFRRCLLELDVVGVMRLWAHVAPHLGQPATPMEALYALHMARTGAKSIPLAQRLYSQRWLNERGLGSLDMPDDRREKRDWSHA